MFDAGPDQGEHGLVASLGFGPEMAAVRERIGRWIAGCSEEMREPVEWQFLAGGKYFRPLAVFSCYRAVHGDAIPERILNAAAVVELFHNVSLIIDDILDKSQTRRGRPTLHARFGELAALMVSGYIVADGYLQLENDYQAIALISELLKRLGVAECMQWRLRRRPAGLEDWRRIAAEDTGSMFEICACLGDRSGRLRRFGGLLGLLYHGCDDVADARGSTALGGGGEEDLRDGILTLPAALAIRDPEVAELFANPEPKPPELSALAAVFARTLPEAEACLDRIAEEARNEAQIFAADPAPLYALVDQTRRLSAR